MPIGFVHRERNIPERRVVHRAIELVRPCRVRKHALDARAALLRRLLLRPQRGQARRDLLAALRQIFRNVVEHLRAVVRRGSSPKLPPCAPLPPRCEYPCDCPAALRRATRRPRRALPCYSRNPAAPVFRRYKVSRCGRSPAPRLHPHAPRPAASIPTWRVAAAAGACANQAGSRYSSRPSLPPSRP